MSSLPCSCLIWANRRSRSSRSDTSRPPISLTAAASCASRRPVMTTSAPSFTNCRAVARPMPLLPPVIKAIFPCSLPCRPCRLRSDELARAIVIAVLLASERFLERAQIHLLRPGRALLAMDIPIGLGDGLDAEQTVLATFLAQGRRPAEQPIAVDAAIDHHMRDVNPERPVLPRHALRDHAQAGLCGGEVRKARLAVQAGGGAGEDDRAAAERRKSPRRLAADQKAAEAADPPELLELLRAQLAEIDAPVVAGIEDDDVGRRAAIARRHRPIEEANDIVLAGRVDRHGFGAAACCVNRLRHLRDLLGRPAGDQHMIALGSEAPGERGAEPALGAHPDNDGSALGSGGAHATLPVTFLGSPAP